MRRFATVARSALKFSRGGHDRFEPAAAQLWWLRPAPLVLLVIVPLYLSFLTFDYENVVLRRYLPNANYLWGLFLLGALALGAGVGANWQDGMRRANPPTAPASAPLEIQIPGWLTAALLVFTVVAYAVWFGPLVSEPELVLQVFSGERDHLRGVLQTMPGVTTLTQCGVAYVVLVTIKRFSVGGVSF